MSVADLPRRPAPAPLQGQLAKVLLVGVVGGFLSGLFGVGGGILIVPALVLVLGMHQRLAHGTSLAAIVPIAISGTIGYALDDSIDWTAALCLALGAATLGAVIGTHLLHRVPRRFLALSFAAVLVATGARLVVDSSEAAGRDAVHVAVVAGLVLVGVVAGILAGLLGVGGGIVMVPAMVVLFDIPAAIAKGTSLVVIIPTALVATRRNLAKANVDLRTAAIVGVAGVASSFAASRVSLGLDERTSNLLFAALLTVLALKMARDELRRGATEPSAA
jgi:uncharacterized membrane protein YfcA